MCDDGKPILPVQADGFSVCYLAEGDMKAINVYERILAVMLCVFLIVFPFITGFHVEELSGIAEQYFAKKSGYQIDLFQYWKETVLVIFSIFLLILLVLGAVIGFILEEKIPERFRMNRTVAALIAVFLLLNILSCIFSEYSEYSFWGLFLDYEGLAAVIGYMILFSAGYFLLGTDRGMKMLMTSVRALAMLLIIGSCMECAFGPMINIETVARALTPDRYEHLMENIMFDYSGSVSLTFVNPGYYGGFCALIFPILYGKGITGGKRVLCICDELLAGGMLFCIIMSGSSGALYAAAAASAAETVFIVYRKRKSGTYWGIPVCLLAAGFVFLLMSRTQIMEGEGLAARVGGSVINPQYTEGEDIFHVDRIQLESGILTVDSGENELKVQSFGENAEMTLDDFLFLDGNGDQIPVETDLLAGSHLTGDYENIHVSVMGRILTIDFGYQDPLEFYCYGGYLSYISFNGDYLDTIPQPEMTALHFLYPLFTGRGYIWVSSIPLAGECILLGKGIGSFPFCYPQSEVAGMLNVHGSADYCIEIAHSWYLQTVVNGGMIALICMLGLFLIHLVKGARFYWKRKEKWEAHPEDTEYIGMGLFFGLIAFQIAGIVNNSTVATGPEFWLLFGAGMGFLFHVRNCSKRSNDLKGKEF